MMYKSAVILLTIAVLSGLSGCKSSRHTVRGDRGRYERVDAADPRAARQVVDCAREWLGTPYRYGGNDRSGVDCSGLTCNVFEQAVGIRLPRTSAQQCEYGRTLERKSLAEGDLVFFVNKTGGKRINHVGLYIGDGKMIHASSSRGVMISSIEDGYWAERYYAGGRVLGSVTKADKKKAPKSKKVKVEESPAPSPEQPAQKDVITIPLSVFEALADSIAAAEWMD